MGKRVIEATERAIARVVDDFQSNQTRYWNERDIHWSLFHCLKQERVIQEAYVTELVRAEFPTLKTFGIEKPARGHYDLVILDPKSYRDPAVQSMPLSAPWADFLKLVKVMVAVEIKLWSSKLRSSRDEMVDWDIQKLTELPNNVLNAYFLNFVQLDFKRPDNKNYYQELRKYLMQQAIERPHLKILCVPSNSKIQPNSSKNWLVSK